MSVSSPKSITRFEAAKTRSAPFVFSVELIVNEIILLLALAIVSAADTSSSAGIPVILETSSGM